MAAYRRVYDSRHWQADCKEPRSALEPYTLQSSTFFCILEAPDGVSWKMLGPSSGGGHGPLDPPMQQLVCRWHNVIKWRVFK